MSGRPAAACVLYAGFLGLWALSVALWRRQPGPYLLLSMALLEAIVLVGAAVGAAQLPSAHREPAVHAGYLLASVAILPLGLLLSRTGDARLDPATLAVALAVLAVVLIRISATAG